MSDRTLTDPATAGRTQMTEILDRLSRLETGEKNKGTVSFGAVQVGPIVITIQDNGGGNYDVIFTNTLNDLTYTISL